MRGPLLEDASEVPLVQRDHPVQTLAANRANQPFTERVGVSCRLHHLRTVRHKPSGLPIPSIRSVAARFS